MKDFILVTTTSNHCDLRHAENNWCWNIVQILFAEPEYWERAFFAL